MSDRATRRIAVADIGGTHARFAVAINTGQSVAIEDLTVLSTQAYPSFDDAWREFASRIDAAEIQELGVSFAGPVRAAPMRLTNGDWTLDPAEMAVSLRLDRVTVVNDLAAIARAIPTLPSASFEVICGPSEGRPPGPLTSVVGLGTGLGLSLLLDDGTTPTAIACEGGHIGFSPQDEVDARILAQLKSRYARVSVERVVSGTALRDLIEALGGQASPQVSDIDLWAHAIDGRDTIATRALHVLLANLGAVAGDFVLAHGSQSVVMVGGLMSRLKCRLSSSAFADRFYAKGRLSDHIAGVPVFFLDNDSAGLIGAALSVPNP